MKPILLAVLVLLASPSYASTVIVSDRKGLLEALASSVDSILVQDGPEGFGGSLSGYGDVTLSRSVALLAWRTDTGVSLPSLGALTVEQGSEDVIVSGFRVRGRARILTTVNALTIESCRFEDGLVQDAPIQPVPSRGTVTVRYCTVLGDLKVNDYAVRVTMNTVLGGSVTAVSRGLSTFVSSNLVQGAPGPGITTGTAQPGDFAVYVSNNVVRNCGAGIVANDTGNATANEIADCLGDGIVGSGRLDAYSNRVERCRGDGIRWGGGSVMWNVVSGSGGTGLKGSGPVQNNTVVLSGGSGIATSPTNFYTGDNLVAFNQGAGVTGGAQNNNGVWMNGADARSSSNTYADPMFCDLNAGDLRLSASSPFVVDGAVNVGALGIGCGVRPVLAAESSTPSLAFGVRSRGGVALVSLSSPEPATLDVLDIAGRRVSRTIVLTSQEVPLNGAAGVLFLKLTQGARVATARAVIVQ